MPSSTTAPSSQQLHRKIFLNTMRSVYPHSIHIRFQQRRQHRMADDDDADDDDAGDDRWTLTPQTIHHCCAVDEKHWSPLMQQLKVLTERHQYRRWQLMASVWVVLLMAASVGGAVLITHPPPLTTVFIISTLCLSLLLGPSMVHHHFLIKPLLSEFDGWKRHLIAVFDQCDVEVIKITTAELLMTPQRRHRWGVREVVGILVLGSGVWFERERMEVEVFWRRVKKEMRRYSLVVIDDQRDGQEQDDEEPGSQETLAEGEVKQATVGTTSE